MQRKIAGKVGTIPEQELDIPAQVARELGWDKWRERRMRALSNMSPFHDIVCTVQDKIKYLDSLTEAEFNSITSKIVLGRARAALDRRMIRRLGNLSPSHAIDGFEVDAGRNHIVMDQGRPAFENQFDERFWSRPSGADLTLKDPLRILIPEDRAANFGRVIEEPEE